MVAEQGHNEISIVREKQSSEKILTVVQFFELFQTVGKGTEGMSLEG